jgi:anti-sigma factor RsiW
LDARLREAALAEPLDVALVQARVRRTIARRPVWVRWAVAAALVIAVSGGLVYRQRAAIPAAADLYVSALRDHAREIVEKQPRPWVADPDIVERMAGDQGVSAPVLARLAPAGYRLEHGKLCRLNGRAYLHLVYENEGRQVSVFLRGGGAERSAHYATQLGTQHLAAVQSDALSVLYVADEAGEVDRLAERAAEVL